MYGNERNLNLFVCILPISSSYRRRYNVSRFHTISARRSSFVSFFEHFELFIIPDSPYSRFPCCFSVPSFLKHVANCNRMVTTYEIVFALCFPLQNFQIQQIQRTRTGRNCQQFYNWVTNPAYSPKHAES